MMHRRNDSGHDVADNSLIRFDIQLLDLILIGRGEQHTFKYPVHFKHAAEFIEGYNRCKH